MTLHFDQIGARRLATSLRVVLGFAFVAWAATFIRSSSVVLANGQRVFCLTDDAMISMRYAENLARGSGLVWNPGERVEGITNPLWTLVMTPPHLLLDRAHTSLAIQVLGIGLLLSIAHLAGRWVRLALAGVDEPLLATASIAAFAASLAYYPLAYWSLMGMETGLVTLLLLAAMCRAADRSADSPFVAIGVLAGLGYWTRPDALTLFAAPCLLAVSMRSDSLARAARAAVLVATPAAAAVAVQLALRLAYYGEVAPNTYHLKIGGIPLATRLLNGWLFTRGFLAEHAWLLAAAAIALVLSPTPVVASAVGVLLTAVGYQIWAGGDVWLYWRLLAPGGLFALLISVVLLARLAQHFLSTRFVRDLETPARRILAAAAWAIVALGSFAAVLGPDWRFRGEIIFWQRPYQASISSALVPKAFRLREVLAPDARIAVGGAGILPYFSGLPAVDFLGKNEKHIARLAPDLEGVQKPPMRYFPGHVKYGLNWVFETYDPDFFEYVRFRREELSSGAMQQFVQVPGLGFLRRNSPRVDWSMIRAGQPGLSD